MRIGYLIPEFPGQTHNFFWQERKALNSFGVNTCLISTKKPVKGIVSASWADEAIAETTYLTPFSITDILNSLRIITSAGGKSIFEAIRIITTTKKASIRGRVRLFLLLVVSTKLVHLSQLQGWEHVHVHSCADSANIAMFASILSKLTYSLTLHNPLNVYGSNQENKWRRAVFCIVITQKIYDEVSSTLKGYLPPRVEIAPMGVDCDYFKRSGDYTAYQKEGSFFIFSCGRLNPIKGHQHLILAVRLLEELGVEVKLFIAGEDEQGGKGYRKELEALIANCNLQNSVFLLGASSEEVVKEYLEKSHAFVLASEYEPLGVATMEAMAMGVPAIATRTGGVMELVEDGVDGLLVLPSSPDSIKDALFRLVGDPEFAKSLSSESRKKILRLFSHKRSAFMISILL